MRLSAADYFGAATLSVDLWCLSSHLTMTVLWNTSDWPGLLPLQAV